MHSASIEIASSCPTLKKKIKKIKQTLVLCCTTPLLGKDEINLKMSVTFCDVFTIERYSAPMEMIMLRKCQAEGACLICCVSIKMY